MRIRYFKLHVRPATSISEAPSKIVHGLNIILLRYKKYNNIDFRRSLTKYIMARCLRDIMVSRFIT